MWILCELKTERFVLLRNSWICIFGMRYVICDSNYESIRHVGNNAVFSKTTAMT